MRKILLGMFFIFSIPFAVMAQPEYPPAEVLVGYSYFRANPQELNLNGWNASVAGNITDWFGVEWDLPPLRFRRAGLPALYCTWARLALFSSVLVTNPEFADERRTLADLGGQVDFQLVIGSSMNTTLSLGVAAAAERGGRPVREFMFSIKIL